MINFYSCLRAGHTIVIVMSTFTMKQPYFYVKENSADNNPPSNKRMKLDQGGNTKEDFHYNSFEEIASGKKQWKSNIKKRTPKHI